MVHEYDDHYEDLNDLCLQNLLYNENVMSQISHELSSLFQDPEEYMIDDEGEWYNFIYDGE